MYQLFRDLADPESETRPIKIVKSNFATLEEALEQARHDHQTGYRVLGVADVDPKNELHLAASHDELEQHFVWTPKDDEQDGRK